MIKTEAVSLAEVWADGGGRKQGLAERQGHVNKWAGWLAVLAILPCLLGGGVSLWSRVAICIVAGILFLVRPPRHTAGTWLPICGAGLLLLGMVAFLPAAWFQNASWRVAFEEQTGILLAPTWSPQPLLSAEAFVSLLLGVGWGLYILSERWGLRAGALAIRVYTGGAAALAALALISHLLQCRIPFWMPVGNGTFGFFPNRNQTANFLALGGILAVAIAFEEWRISRRKGLLWLGAVAVLVGGLLLSNSRAGLLLFVAGVLMWVFCVGVFFRVRAIVRPAIILLSAIALGALLFGGQLIDRLVAGSTNGRSEFRSVIHADALKLSWQAPWTGVGLSNFEAIYRLERAESRRASYAVHPENDWAWQIRTLHPESDWLWGAVEMGWGAPLLVAVALGGWLRRCFPFQPGSRRLTRCAALIGGICFVIHGFQDVSGHRLGTVWAALFVMSTAIPPVQALPALAMTRWSFRCLGAILVAIGTAGLLFYGGLFDLPSHERMSSLRAEVDAAAAAQQGERVETMASQALRIAPLEWSLYFQRGVFRALRGATDGALSDFRASRFLERGRGEEAISEGILWLSLGHSDHALEAWEEAIRRSPDGGMASFQITMSRIAGQPSGLSVLEQLARDRPDLAMVLFERDGRSDFERFLRLVRQTDPWLRNFSPAQRQSILQRWKAVGNLQELQQFLTERRPFGEPAPTKGD